MQFTRQAIEFAIAAVTVCGVAAAQLPNHPIITEVYTDPVGSNDGPVGRDGASAHQEFIELYVPPAGSLRAGLNKDALRLTFYEVEGDSSSSGLGLVNYRFDLPTIDADSSNGITPGAIARPTSGVFVLGWVDYVGNPPTDLAGIPGARIALINGGLTSTSGYTFIAINGAHFGGTTNFPTVVAESLIDVPSETRSGIVQNGSGVYLLVNRDDPGYVELFDDQHVPTGQSANPHLENGTGLGISALLDGYAANDDPLFNVLDQPYTPPTGDDIDLETVLPSSSPFADLCPQIPERISGPPDPGDANGYARVYIDRPKTTETAAADDPVVDALNAYRHSRNDGPFYPTPGSVVLTTSPPRLGVPSGAAASVPVLGGTTNLASIPVANVGGDYDINISAAVGASSDPSTATFTGTASATNVGGQQAAAMTGIAVGSPATAVDGTTATADFTVSASNANGGDPAVIDPVQVVPATAIVVNPTVGRDENGAPLQATVYIAVLPIYNTPATNDFLPTSLGAFVATNFGGLAQDRDGHGAAMIDPATDLTDPAIVPFWVDAFPSNESEYINHAGPTGRPDLVGTVLNSAEMLSGADSYVDTFNNDETALRGLHVNVVDTISFGGTFSPSEAINFAEPGGRLGQQGIYSGVTTTRTFEIAIIDTNVRADGTIETGATDDFGIVIEALDVEPGSPILPGEFVFLSMSGGLQGADIDGFNVANSEQIIANAVLFDLDNLHDVLGIRSIEAFWMIDAGDGAGADFIEAFSLNPIGVAPPCPGDLNGDGVIDLGDLAVLLSNFGTMSGATLADGDVDGDGDVDLTDLAIVLAAFGTTCP